MDEIAVQVAKARGESLTFQIGLDPDAGDYEIVDLGDFLRHLTDVPDDVAVARDAAFASTTQYTTVPAGTWTVEASGGSPKLHTSAPVKVTAGTVSSVLVLDAKTSGITVRTVLDSAAAGSTPAGSVPAGGGGTAVLSLDPAAPGVASSGLAALLLGTVVGGMWLLRRRVTARQGAHAAS